MCYNNYSKRKRESELMKTIILILFFILLAIDITLDTIDLIKYNKEEKRKNEQLNNVGKVK